MPAGQPAKCLLRILSSVLLAASVISTGSAAQAASKPDPTPPMKAYLCSERDEICPDKPSATPPYRSDAPGPASESEEGMSNEMISLYKTVTYVPSAALTDQLWYLLIASEAATTGPFFLGVNASTSSAMTYTYEYFWNLCCLAEPGPDGVVPVSATKAIIYRALSIIRVGALAIAFGNTLGSSAAVTTVITISRTAVYVTNDYFWNAMDARPPSEPELVGGDEPAASGSIFIW